MLPILRKHKPNWFYEALPLLYAATGVATILTLQNLMAYFAGLVLIGAGASTVWMRATARFGLAGAISLDKTPSGGFVRVALGPEQLSGHPVIDVQHADLCAIANTLLDHATRGGKPADAEPLLSELRDDLKRHFADEERLIAEYAPETYDRHVAAHHELMEKLRRLIDGCQSGRSSIKTIVEFVAVDLVTQHIAREDRSYFDKLPPALKPAAR